jgi:hypothetical protein
MSLLTPYKRLLLNLRQEVSTQSRSYMSRDEAYDELKQSTGEDFGYDPKLWEEWIRKNTDELDWKP